MNTPNRRGKNEIIRNISARFLHPGFNIALATHPATKTPKPHPYQLADLVLVGWAFPVSTMASQIGFKGIRKRGGRPDPFYTCEFTADVLEGFKRLDLISGELPPRGVIMLADTMIDPCPPGHPEGKRGLPSDLLRCMIRGMNMELKSRGIRYHIDPIKSTLPEHYRRTGKKSKIEPAELIELRKRMESGATTNWEGE